MEPGIIQQNGYVKKVLYKLYSIRTNQRRLAYQNQKLHNQSTG